MTVISPTQPTLPTTASRPRSALRGLGMFFRRAPFSAFWGCIAAAILVMAVPAPGISAYEPLKSDFRSMSKPPRETHWVRDDQIRRHGLSRLGYRIPASLYPALRAVP